MIGLQEGQKVLIIRYGKKPDCIDKHCEVIEDIGYCWFGKIGVIPSKKAIDAIQSEEAPKIVLFSQGNGYVADVEEISYDKPDDGYPQYYQEELFDKLLFPKTYYKLVSLQQLTGEELAKFKIVSSRNPALETLNSSMSSFFFVEYGKSRPIEVKKENPKKTKKQLLDINDCAYQNEGMCSRKGFVNYKYECKRASNCMGQKR